MKYSKGECLSIEVREKLFMGIIITSTQKEDYDFTLLNYNKDKAPVLSDFIQGEIFGTRFGSVQDFEYAVNVKMLKINYVDSLEIVNKVGILELKPSIIIDGYVYLETIEELYQEYSEELFVRIEKSNNSEIYPQLGFAGQHLIKLKNIIREIANLY